MENLKLDPKIKDLVIGLLGLKIKAFLSCEGHRQEGFHYPWVDVEYGDKEKLLRIVAWYNVQAYSHKTKSKVVWVILPRATMRLMPDKNGFTLTELQASAMEFGQRIRGLNKIPRF